MISARFALLLGLVPASLFAQFVGTPLTSFSTAAAPGKHTVLSLESNGDESLALISTSYLFQGPDPHLSVSRIDSTGRVTGPMIPLSSFTEGWRTTASGSIAPADEGFVVVRECGAAHSPSICADTIKGNSHTSKVIAQYGKNPAIAFDGTTYAVLFGHYPPWGFQASFEVVRLDKSLNTLGPALNLGNASGADIAALSNGFYVVSSEVGDFDPLPPVLYGREIDASGALQPKLELNAGDHPSLAFDGERLALLFRDSQALKARFLTEGAWSSPRLIDSSIHAAQITVGPSGFVLTHTRYPPASGPRSKLSAITLSSSGEVQQRFDIGEGDVNEWGPLATTVGGKLLFVWSRDESRDSWALPETATVRSRLMDPFGLPSDDARTVSVSPSHQGNSSVAYTGSGYLVATEEYTGDLQRSVIKLTAFNRYGTRLVDRRVIKTSSFPQVLPRLIPGAADEFLVLFAEADRPRGETLEYYSGQSRLFGAIVDSMGQEKVAPFTIAETADEVSNAVWNGREWVVVWSDKSRSSRDPNGVLQLTRVGRGGALLQTIPLTFIHESDGDAAPAIAWSGDRYLVTWLADIYSDCRMTCPIETPELRARRLDANFTNLDQEPLLLSRGRTEGSPDVVWTGERFTIAATTADHFVYTTLHDVSLNGEVGEQRPLDHEGIRRGFTWSGGRYGVLLEQYLDVELALIDGQTHNTEWLRVAASDDIESGGSLAAGPGGEYFVVFGSRQQQSPGVQRLFVTTVDGLAVEALAAPSDLRVISDESRIFLEWSDNSSQEEGFQIEYRKDSGNYRTLGSVPANTTSVFVRAFPAIGTYHFRVRATTRRHSSDFSNEATAFIALADAAPDGLTVEATTRTTISLRWNDRSESETGFVIEVTDTRTGERRTLLTPAGTSSFTVTDLRPATTYSFRVRAALGVDLSEASNEAIGATLSRSRIVKPTTAGSSSR